MQGCTFTNITTSPDTMDFTNSSFVECFRTHTPPSFETYTIRRYTQTNAACSQPGNSVTDYTATAYNRSTPNYPKAATNVLLCQAHYGSCTFTPCLFSGCTSSTDGGAIYLVGGNLCPNAQLNLNSCHFMKCTAATAGAVCVIYK